jgi:hypothetical protein
MAHSRSGFLGACLLLIGTPALAQTAVPRVEIFGGYSLLPADGQDFPRATSHGVQGSVTLNLTRGFGIVADIGRQWSTARDLGPGFQGLVAHTRVTEYLVGPRLVGRSEEADVFVHGLIGLADGDAGEEFEGFTDRKLAFGGGGGVDVHVSRRVSVRAQVDLLGSFADIVEGNTRFAVGAVVRLGGS